MKKIRSFVAFSLVICLLQACKKNSTGSSLPPDPIAVYKFDKDYVTNSVSSLLHGQVEGSITSTPDSFLTNSACFYFPGDSYVKVKDSDLIDFGGNQFTLAAWIKPVEPHYSYIIIKNEDANSYPPYSLDIHPGVVRAFVRTNTDEQFLIEGKTTIPEGAWQHIAATFTGNELTVYYNGNEEGSIAVDRPLAFNKGDLTIGGNTKYQSANFHGSIDNVHIYDKALTASQVKYLYQHYND